MNFAHRQQLKVLRSRLRAVLSNRLTYPKTLLGIACDRPLTLEEYRKSSECLEECLQLVEAELSMLLWKLEGSAGGQA